MVVSPINHALEWLYPKEDICAKCGQPAYVLCARCRMPLLGQPKPACPICGRPSPGGLCRHCANGGFVARRGVAAYDYGFISPVITQFKFADRRDYVPFLTQGMAHACQALPLCDIDAVVAVPLHGLRLLRRGYNQSELLARALAMLLDKPFLPGALHRPKYCRPASRLGIDDLRRARQANASFALRQNSACGHTVLLVDDVLTSGATLNSCARLLLACGARDVYTVVAGAVAAY